MRKDEGLDGDAQRISQMVWMLFIKIFADKVAKSCKSSVKPWKARTLTFADSSGTATTCSLEDISIPAALEFTIFAIIQDFVSRGIQHISTLNSIIRGLGPMSLS
ncbi:MAG: hypothetical protein R2879_20105 [Saprospiraceae bacterium]